MVRLSLVIVAAAALLWAGAPVAAGAKVPGWASAKACTAMKTKAARKRCSRPRTRPALRHLAGHGVARGVADGLAGALGALLAGPGAGGSGGVAGPAAPGGGPAVAAPGAVPVVTSTVGVEARDTGGFVLRLTRTAVPAGNLTIFFRNLDSSKHNLSIEPPSGASLEISDDVGEGLGATRTVAVTAGTWRLYCSLAGHDSMTRDLAVL